mmetsp:Transcript_23209/g.64886  ORF Transcript_23209/g.64886 Transcript_23209/m.64886 type:complete len:276 (-) Transcript_23209:117-944(-)
MSLTRSATCCWLCLCTSAMAAEASCGSLPLPGLGCSAFRLCTSVRAIVSSVYRWASCVLSTEICWYAAASSGVSSLPSPVSSMVGWAVEGSISETRGGRRWLSPSGGSSVAPAPSADCLGEESRSRWRRLSWRPSFSAATSVSLRFASCKSSFVRFSCLSKLPTSRRRLSMVSSSCWCRFSSSSSLSCANSISLLALASSASSCSLCAARAVAPPPASVHLSLSSGISERGAPSRPSKIATVMSSATSSATADGSNCLRMSDCATETTPTDSASE